MEFALDSFHMGDEDLPVQIALQLMYLSDFIGILVAAVLFDVYHFLPNGFTDFVRL